MSQHADESVDQDPLLEFENEPKPEPAIEDSSNETAQPTENGAVATAAATEAEKQSLIALNGRLEGLERALEASANQVATLSSEVATLVGTIADMKKRDTVAVPRVKVAAPQGVRSQTGSAVAAAIVGIAIALAGWTLWSRQSLDARGPAQQPVVIDAPIAAAPPQPAIALASTQPIPAPAPARDQPARAEAPRAAARPAYVGTLSIDSEPGGEVFINRRPAGRTPLRITNLKAGSHLVWIEREGYQRFTRVVQVPADRVSRVSASLDPIAPR